MTWRVEIDHRAEREMVKLPDEILRRLVERVRALAGDPFPRGVKKLMGGGYRLRIGDYRVLYDAVKAKRLIVIYAVGHRRDVYR